LLARPLNTGETLSFLCGDWRILQLADGHRWSIDDHATALVALQEARRLLLLPPEGRPEAPAGGARAPLRPSLRTLDLGCGVGSVLLMTSWGLLGGGGLGDAASPSYSPAAGRRSLSVGVGIEAQAASAALARRSAEHNLGRGQRGVVVVEGDLRDAATRRRAAAEAMAAEALLSASSSCSSLCSLSPPPSAGGPPPPPDRPLAIFDLVTGTPPYIVPGAGALSARPQKGACCVETRGGVEEYCAAAAELLGLGGVFVCCAGVTPDDGRARRAARRAGLSVRRRVVVVPRRGKPPLFEVLVMERRKGNDGGRGEEEEEAGDNANADADADADAVADEFFLVREADGELAADMHAARAALGMPPAKGAPVY